MLWTHNFDTISYNAEYVPDGCSAAGLPAAIMGSGVQAREAYAFAGQHDHAITLGACPSVGVAGGYAQGGGHGPMGRLHGLAVDNILQYRIVTYDGVLRVANACVSSFLIDMGVQVRAC